MFYPKIGDKTNANLFREISENSLGYNNILYLATVLAELERTEECLFKVLLIEEPEAHLHPQLQIRLMKYLQEQSKESDIQIIVTTHSATITASADLESLNVITLQENKNPKATLLKDCKVKSDTKFFLERWLDITKSTLFFAKGLIFVEGIAEALVIKELAKKIVKDATKDDFNQRETLDDCGVSIINLNGIYFKHFFQLFQGYQLNKKKLVENVDYIPIRCAGITDCDPRPVKDSMPTYTKPCKCGNTQSSDFKQELIDNNSEVCKIFTNLKTFEYDLGMEGNNLQLFYKIEHESLINETVNKRYVKKKSEINWSKNVKIENKAKSCLSYLKDDIELKGEFSQILAKKLYDNPDLEFEVPQYIKDAIIWAINK